MACTGAVAPKWVGSPDAPTFSRWAAQPTITTTGTEGVILDVHAKAAEKTPGEDCSAEEVVDRAAGEAKLNSLHAAELAERTKSRTVKATGREKAQTDLGPEPA